MQEINTVINWLERLTQDDWADFYSDSEVQNIAKATLELLKEQDNEIDTLKTLLLGYETGMIQES